MHRDFIKYSCIRKNSKIRQFFLLLVFLKEKKTFKHFKIYSNHPLQFLDHYKILWQMRGYHSKRTFSKLIDFELEIVSYGNMDVESNDVFNFNFVKLHL